MVVLVCLLFSVFLFLGLDYKSCGDLYAGGLQHAPAGHHLQQLHRRASCGTLNMNMNMDKPLNFLVMARND